VSACRGAAAAAVRNMMEGSVSPQIAKIVTIRLGEHSRIVGYGGDVRSKSKRISAFDYPHTVRPSLFKTRQSFPG